MRWTESELRLALALYCQLPFGKMHFRNPAIVKLAAKIGSTPSAVAMKLVNFASLDPEIVNSGRSGLGNASAADRRVWESFLRNWEGELSSVIEEVCEVSDIKADTTDEEVVPISMDTTRRAVVEVRIKQHLFRRMILSSYESACCMSGLSDSSLLVASHIVPWNKSKENRLNPKNGLCLSVLHDKAFDRGLITVTPDLSIVVSSRLRKLKDDSFVQSALLAYDGKMITRPEKFLPDQTLLLWHNQNIFLP